MLIRPSNHNLYFKCLCSVTLHSVPSLASSASLGKSWILDFPWIRTWTIMYFAHSQHSQLSAHWPLVNFIYILKTLLFPILIFGSILILNLYCRALWIIEKWKHFSLIAHIIVIREINSIIFLDLKVPSLFGYKYVLETTSSKIQ